MSFVVRSSVAPGALIPLLRSACRGFRRADGRHSDDGDIVAASTREARFRTMLVTIYAAGCALLRSSDCMRSCAFRFATFTRSGVRIAVAPRPSISSAWSCGGGRVVLSGSVIGFVGLVVVVRPVALLLFGVSLFEPLVFIGSAACACEHSGGLRRPGVSRRASRPCHLSARAMKRCDALRERFISYDDVRPNRVQELLAVTRCPKCSARYRST